MFVENKSDDNVLLRLKRSRRTKYKPESLSREQRLFVIGGSFVCLLAVSYLFDYFIYMCFTGVTLVVTMYDNEQFVKFVNKNKFLGTGIINRVNIETFNLKKMLSPSGVIDGVSKGVTKSAGLIGRFAWLSQLGLAGGLAGGSVDDLDDDKKDE